jgi:hypothetical protein
MMTRKSIAVLALGMAACSAQHPPVQVAQAAGTQVSCIDLTRVIGRRAQPPSSLLFEMVGGATYRNDVGASCPGIERANGTELIQTESQGKQLCRDDSVRVYDAAEAKATGSRSFAKCRLRNFTLVAAR